MPASFDMCVKNGGRVRTKTLSDGKYMHVCFLDGKSYAGEIKTKGESMNELLMYSRPILTEASNMNGERKLFIKGNAIEVGVSKNGVMYTEEELRNAAKTLIGVPLLRKHYNNYSDGYDINNIIGKVVEAGFDGNNVPFKAQIDTGETDIIRKLESGLINKVSIGASTKKDVEGDDGIIYPEGIEFHELTLAAVPGVKNASINQVIAESYKVKNMEKTKIEQLEEKFDKLVKANEALEKKLLEQDSEVKPAKQEELKDLTPELKPTPEPVTEEVKELRKQMEKLAESVSKITDKPKGIAETGESKLEEKFGFNRGNVLVEHIEGQPSGISEIYTPDSARENDDPTSSRRWALY